MSFPKKGTRKIVVYNECYYWRIRKKMTHNEKHGDALGIPIQHESGGTILIANLGYCRAGALGGYPPNSIPNIKPSTIKCCIAFAIKNGWNYEAKSLNTFNIGSKTYPISEENLFLD